MDNTIEAHGLVKRFGATTALGGASRRRPRRPGTGRAGSRSRCRGWASWSIIVHRIPPGRPPLAPVGPAGPVELAVAQVLQGGPQPPLALLEPREGGGRRGRGGQVGEAEAALAKGPLVVHDLAVGQVDQPPADGGERRRVGVGLGVVGHPGPGRVAVDALAAGHGLPEVLVVGQFLQPPPQAGVDLVHLGQQQLGTRHRHHPRMPARVPNQVTADRSR